MCIRSYQSFTLFHIQSSSSSTYQPPVWLMLFLCMCSHSLELIASQHLFLWISNNFPENTLKHFISNLHFLVPRSDPIPPVPPIQFLILMLYKFIYLLTYLQIQAWFLAWNKSRWLPSLVVNTNKTEDRKTEKKTTDDCETFMKIYESYC